MIRVSVLAIIQVYEQKLHSFLRTLPSTSLPQEKRSTAKLVQWLVSVSADRESNVWYVFDSAFLAS